MCGRSTPGRPATVHEHYTQSFDKREKFGMEHRLRRHDRDYRWILDTGVPRFHKDGQFAGYIGSCVDVTETIRGILSICSLRA